MSQMKKNTEWKTTFKFQMWIIIIIYCMKTYNIVSNEL